MLFTARARALKKIKFFDADIVVKNKWKMWIIVVCTLIDDEYASLLFPEDFSLLFLPVERVCKCL